jgi:hypothetical protein
VAETESTDALQLQLKMMEENLWWLMKKEKKKLGVSRQCFSSLRQKTFD